MFYSTHMPSGYLLFVICVEPAKQFSRRKVEYESIARMPCAAQSKHRHV